MDSQLRKKLKKMTMVVGSIRLVKLQTKKSLLITLAVLLANSLYAQEVEAPLGYNVIQYKASQNPKKSTASHKRTALSLPFFEDFTGTSPIPDETKWLDRKVYVNNTMGVNPISRGVATFDALNGIGIPYDTVSKTSLAYADSLTSQEIDLSGYQPSDSLYLSFCYQPEGLGFYPEGQDSLMLYMKRTNGWARVWSVPGARLHDFKQVMIPIKDASYFHSGFQIRFVNKASMVINDDVWNVDYIRIDANRNINDTLVNDVALNINPTFFTSDYTFMPYHQFVADLSNERATQHEATIKNNTNTTQSVNYNFTSREKVTGAPLSSSLGNALSIPANSDSKITFPSYTNIPTAPAKNHPSVFEHKYYIETLGTGDSRPNDTIVHEQFFHNFLAYDDGTAERSYFLNLFATLPGKIAIEHHLNEPDTLSGIAIYFGRQVPLARQKYFSVVVYKDIEFGGGTDQIIYQEDFLIPQYSITNDYWVYKLESSVPLPAGKFYIGTIQPALSNSDSLYFGLDVNRTGDNHAYFSVLNTWEKSKANGAIMMRPMFGKVFSSVVSSSPLQKGVKWTVSPNPTQEIIQFEYNSDDIAIYELIDVQGRVLKRGDIKSGDKVNLASIVNGIYFVRFSINGVYSDKPQKIIKY